MIRRLIVIGLTGFGIALIASGAGPVIFSGIVHDDSGVPVDGAMVRVSVAGAIKVFAIVKNQGAYRLEVSNVADIDSVDMTVQCMGYEKQKLRMPLCDTTRDIVLFPASVGLREVTVSAAEIVERGDTLAYNLASFLGKSDVTLEDGLKKLPGVEVEKSGKISYQGRSISNFYIDGMDMLGGKYGLATRTLPADYVSKVEIIDHHHDAKIDRGRQSDNVALNVRLKSSVKFRPAGTTDGAVGYSDRLLYNIGGAGMMFTPSFQTMVSAKAGNISEFATHGMTDFIDHGRLSVSDAAGSYIGNLSGSAPHVSSIRYISPSDRMVSINAMKKSSDDVSLKANVSYAYSATDYEYSERSSYYAGDRAVVFEETNYPYSRVHRPMLDVTYSRNAETVYFGNTFNAMAEFTRNDFMTVSDGSTVNQLMKKECVSVIDNTSWRIKHGDLIWNFSGGIGYNASPSVGLAVTSQDNDGGNVDWNQRLYSDMFKLRGQAGTSYLSGRSRFDFGIGGKYTHDVISSDLVNTAAINRVIGNSGTISLDPHYEYTSGNGRYELACGLDVALVTLHASNHATGARIDYDRVHFNPSVRFKYNLNASVGLLLSAKINNVTGDALDLMTAHVMTSYRGSRVASGVMMAGRGFDCNMRLDFKKPVDYWWLSADVSFGDSRKNVLGSQYVTDSDVASGAISGDNTSRRLSASLSVTKHFPAVHGKFTLRGSYSLSVGDMIQQNDMVRHYGQSVSVNPHFSVNPWPFLELSYRGDIVKTFNRYLAVRDSYAMMGHNVHLSVFPVDAVDIFCESEFVSRKIQNAGSRNVALFDAGVRYRYGKIRLELRVNNILDMHHYYYTVYTGLDTHSLSYALRPRMYTLSVTFIR